MTVTTDRNPIDLFKEWMTEAERLEPSDANAMSLATVGEDGRPSLRMVLLKDVDQRGFTFYTNLGSRKSGELQANPVAALCFHWKSLKRQVRVEGDVEPVDDAEAVFAKAQDRQISKDSAGIVQEVGVNTLADRCVTSDL